MKKWFGAWRDSFLILGPVIFRTGQHTGRADLAMRLKHLLTGFYHRLVGGRGRRLPNHKKEDAALDEIDRIAREIDSAILPVR